MDISVSELTTYEVSADGKSVTLKVLDENGDIRALSFQIPELGSLVVTLPALIEAALRRQIRDASFRFTFPMGSWSIEQAADPSSVIVTLRTRDGFEVSYSMSSRMAEEFGGSLAAAEMPPRPVLTH